MTTATVRDAEVGDAEAIMALYNHEVLTGTATFDLETRSLDAQIEWIEEHQRANPAVVAELDSVVVGFASLSPFKTRAAYRTTVENSIYVAELAQGRGIGRLLLSAIVERARMAGFHTIIARIGGDNPASMALHESLGYTVVGIERQVGRKFGRWLDCTEMQLML